MIARTTAVAAVGALAALAAAAAEPSAPRVGAEGRPLAALAAHRLHVTVDKPLYRPGETVWLRGWELESAGLVPVAEAHAVTAELVDPRGGVVQRRTIRAERGVVAGDLVLAEGLAGGRYTLRLRSELGGSLDHELVVARYELPRFRQEVVFDRASYAPGDPVALGVTVTGPDDAPLERALVTATVWLDGAALERPAARTDRRGRAALRFRLPSRIARGDGLVTLTVDHGGVTEVVQRRVPIALAEVVLAAYPEGGDLVAGLPGRLFFAATTPLGAPVEVAVELVDDAGRAVARAESEHRGRGAVELVPRAGASYRLRVRGPGPLRGEVEVPAVQESGCVLGTAATPGRAIAARVACTAAEEVTLVARLRGRELARQTVRADPGGADAALPVDPGAQGVVVVTLYRRGGAPVAERLVYRGLGEGVRVDIEADRDGYAPRDPVRLTVRTRDASGAPVAADLALSVIDRAVLSIAGEPEHSILSRLYLEPELPGQRVDDAATYFAATPEAPRALDLLLATKGWRRFRAVRR